MRRLATKTFRLLPQIARAGLVSLALAAPVVAMPISGSSQGRIIEAPAQHKIGAGFVLLVSLQRN